MRPVANGVARVLGLKLFARGKRASAQNEALLGLMTLENFPKALRGWIAVDAVREFAQANLEISKDKRSFKIFQPRMDTDGHGLNSGGQQTAATKELPKQNKPASDDELFLSPEEMLGNRLKFNLDIYLNPHLHRHPMSGAVQRLTGSEVSELRAAGMLPKFERPEDGDGGQPQGSDFVFPNFTTNLTTLASYYKKRFEPLAGRQFSCNKQTIKNWQSGKGVPRTKEWHPAADAGGRFWLNTNQNCFKWFEETMLPLFKRPVAPAELGGADGLAGTAPLRDILEERERIERKEILLRDAEIERALGNLMDVGAAEQVFKGFALRVDAEIDAFVTSKGTLRAVVARVTTELLMQRGHPPSPEFMAELDDRLTKELALAYDGLKLKFAAAQADQSAQMSELAKPVLKN